MHTNDAVIRPRYAETDQMGVVYHANYLTWFEVGRCEFLRALGYSYRRLEEDGVILPVIRAEVDYRHAARYDDDLRVRTRLVKLQGARMELRYEVLRLGDGGEELLATGMTAHAFVGRDLKALRLRKANPEMWELLNGCLEEENHE